MFSYHFYVGTGRVRGNNGRGNAVSAANTEALRLFGGYTLLEGFGGWRPGGDLPDTQEETLIWEIITWLDAPARQFAKYLKRTFDQDMVLMTWTVISREEV
mgnify:CR=1 FL=1